MSPAIAALFTIGCALWALNPHNLQLLPNTSKDNNMAGYDFTNTISASTTIIDDPVLPAISTALRRRLPTVGNVARAKLAEAESLAASAAEQRKRGLSMVAELTASRAPQVAGLGIYDALGVFRGWAAVRRRRHNNEVEVGLADAPQPLPRSMYRGGLAARRMALALQLGLEASHPGCTLRAVAQP